MSDLASVMQILSQQGAPKDTNTIMSGIQYARGQRQMQDIIEQMRNSQTTEDEYKNALTQQIGVGNQVKQATLPFDLEKLQAQTGEINTQAQERLQKILKDKRTEARTNLFSTVDMALKSGNPGVAAPYLAKAAQAGAIDPEQVDNFMSAPMGKKMEVLKKIHSGLYQDAEYYAKKDLQDQEIAGRMKTTLAGKDSQLEAVRGQMRGMVEKFGPEAINMPQYKALAAIISPTGIFAQERQENAQNFTSKENEIKQLEKVANSLIAPMAERQAAKDRIKDLRGGKLDKPMPSVRDLSDDELKKSLGL